MPWPAEYGHWLWLGTLLLIASVWARNAVSHAGWQRAVGRRVAGRHANVGRYLRQRRLYARRYDCVRVGRRRSDVADLR